MKGQFLLMSAIIVGIILITTSSAISSIQSEEIRTSPMAYELRTIQQEAEGIDFSDSRNRERFKDMIESTRYSTNTSYWSSKNCFNITLRNRKTDMFLSCVG